MDENTKNLEALQLRVSQLEGLVSQLKTQLLSPIMPIEMKDNLSRQLRPRYRNTVPSNNSYNGDIQFYFDGTKYWLYTFMNGAWKKVELT